MSPWLTELQFKYASNSGAFIHPEPKQLPVISVNISAYTKTHNMKLLSLLTFASLVFCLPSEAQIDSIKYGLKGKIIRAMAQSPQTPSTYYAGLKGSKLGTGHIYQSTDSGTTWTIINNGQPLSGYVADIQAIAVASDLSHTIYAGTWKNGLFKSTDGGQSFQNDSSFPSADIRSIKTGIQHPSLVYASTSAFGVVSSTDGGKSWTRNNPALIDSTFQFAWSIEINKNDDRVIYAQTFNNGVWKSSDQGTTWNKTLDTDGKVAWDMHIEDNGLDLWVAASTRGDTLSTIYHSDNAGEDWNEITDVPQIGISEINVQRDKGGAPNILIGSWRGGVYMRSENTWNKVEEIDYDTIAEILKHKGEFVIGSWGNGIYRIK